MLVLRRVRRGELDPELLALAVIGTLAILAAVWLFSGLPVPGCVFRAWTGLPCLTCGGTRCVRGLLAGDFTAAAAWNPLVFAGVVLGAMFVVYAVVVTLFRLPRFRVESWPAPVFNALRIVAVLLLAANWIYLVRRFSSLG